MTVISLNLENEQAMFLGYLGPVYWSPEPQFDDILLFYLIREELDLHSKAGAIVIQGSHVLAIDCPQGLDFLLLEGVAL